jgi:SOS response regulatory protein OraA/RecX
MAYHKVCRHVYDYPDAQFASGMKVMTVKENRWAEQRGPSGIHQPRKTETSLPTRREDICPFKISICFNKKDDLFYLSKNGSVLTHSGHVRRTVIFAKADQIDQNLEKMIKDFEVANVKPSTASRLLHQMEDRAYDPKAISNVITKAKKTWLSDRGINTKAAPAQVQIDYLIVSPDTSCVFLLHDPEMPLTSGAKKCHPKKTSPMSVATKYFNSQVVETEMIPQISAEQYATARRKALYLPESDCLLLYAAWITNKELRNTLMFPEFLAFDITGDIHIDDHILMIVAGLENMRRIFSSLRAFLPSECKWVFHFSLSYVFPKLLGQGTVRRIKQVSSILTQLIQHPCANVAQSPLHGCN